MVSCCDIYGNAGGDWVGCISGMAEFEGNQWEDPLFCDAAAGDLALETASSCAPDNSPPGCGRIGAHAVGCNPNTLALAVEAEKALALQLEPAVPNPFNPSTEIACSIPASAASSRVVMTIHDATGREVATLVDADQGPGRYRVTWDGRNDDGATVASGVYFCRLVWRGRSKTRRVILLR